MESSLSDEQRKEIKELFIGLYVAEIKNSVALAIDHCIVTTFQPQIEAVINRVIDKARTDIIREIVARMLAVSIEEWKNGPKS